MQRWFLLVPVLVWLVSADAPTVATQAVGLRSYIRHAAVPAGVAPCLGAALRGVANWQGATGSLLGALTITNRGARPCDLRGRALVLLMTTRGVILPVAQRVGAAGHATQGGSIGVSSVVEPRQRVRVLLQWANWCGRRTGPLTLIFALPGGLGGFAVALRDGMGRPVRTVPRCDTPSSPSELRVGPFEPLVP